MKKILLGLGTITAVVVPIAVTVSCFSSEVTKEREMDLAGEQANFKTLDAITAAFSHYHEPLASIGDPTQYKYEFLDGGTTISTKIVSLYDSGLLLGEKVTHKGEETDHMAYTLTAEDVTRILGQPVIDKIIAWANKKTA